MKKVEAWKAKVADLRRFSEKSLKQMEEDKEYLLRLLKDLDDSLEMLKRMPSNPNIKIRVLEYSSFEPKAFRRDPCESTTPQGVKAEGIDLHKILADQGVCSVMGFLCCVVMGQTCNNPLLYFAHAISILRAVQMRP